MLPAHEITKSLPPTRDDEPSSLRQDIVDEILDHLQSALRRELLVRGTDEVTAKQQVLNRFGNPDQVARRLWFQAMWSRIMTQRLVIGSAICSTVVSISLVAMLGWFVQQTQQQQREQQKFNASLIEQVTKLMQPAPVLPVRDPNMNSLQIKVRSGTKDGPPARGIEVRVGRLPGIGEGNSAFGGKQTVDFDQLGVADCGFVKSGFYEATVITPWNEQSTVKFTIHPGKDHIEEIIVPERMPDSARVSLQVNGVTDEPLEVNHVLVIRFVAMGSREVAGRTWTKGTAEIVGDSIPVLMVVPNQGIWSTEIKPHFESTTDLITGIEELWPPRLAKGATWTRMKASQEFQLPTNRYSVQYALVELRKLTGPEAANWRSSVIADTCSPISPNDEYKVSPADELVATAGKLNDWTIELPGEVVRRYSGSRAGE